MADLGYKIGSLARSHEKTMSLFVQREWTQFGEMIILLGKLSHEEPRKRFVRNVLKFYETKLKFLVPFFSNILRSRETL